MSNTEAIDTILQGEQFGRFQGAKVDTVLSGTNHSPEELTAAREKLSQDIERLIRKGDILYCEPGQEPDSLFKADGNPYFGRVHWEDGKMLIKRVPIFT